MSADQVKRVEEISQELIAKNQPVYAKDSSLPLAKAVKGLRAVFDETYPDPVRIVSIGVPVEDLLVDPTSNAGLGTSVEFCGGTHLKRSGHIGDFVITTEEAIAKGIRRIIAITGPEATRANARAAELEKAAADLKVYITANEANFATLHKKLVQSIVDLQGTVSASDISAWRKDRLRTQLNELKKLVDKAERDLKTAQTNEVTATAKQLATDNLGAAYLVEVLNAGSNSKALDSALKQVKTVSPSTAAMFFSVDHESGKVLCMAGVGKETVQKGLAANDWVNNISQLVGGKGGGKQESAQATGTKVEALDEAVKLSREFAKLKLGA